MVAVIGEQRLRPAKISQLDSVAHLLKHAVPAGVALAAVSAIGILAIAAGGAVSPSAALLSDLLVSGVDILHLLLCQIGQRAVMIIVRMIFPGQIPVSLFDFLIGGGPGNSQDLVWIVHSVSSISLIFFLLGRWKLPSSTAFPT